MDHYCLLRSSVIVMLMEVREYLLVWKVCLLRDRLLELVITDVTFDILQGFRNSC